MTDEEFNQAADTFDLAMQEIEERIVASGAPTDISTAVNRARASFASIASATPTQPAAEVKPTPEQVAAAGSNSDTVANEPPPEIETGNTGTEPGNVQKAAKASK